MPIIHANSLPRSMYRPTDPDSPFINIADLVNEETGKTYREENAEKIHNIPIGALVEVRQMGNSDGARLFVVSHERDCDMTPLYSLAIDPDDTEIVNPGFGNRKWNMGYPECCLIVIE